MRRVLVDAALVVRNVAGLRQSILDAFEEDDAVTLDLVEEAVDLCGVQLIEAARRQAQAVGKTLSLAHPGEAFRPVLEAAGFLTEASEDDLRFWFHEGSVQ
ncbi:lipid asymmetry maintenance protein MlaB [Brevundimonas sp. Bb-A]|jgi:anti-anti-sigma regulatory factor|uniref:STAS domain-containing protein n=1 Tax=Brevundimonas sp. Bb-A TaxID=2560058 RepID=UPI00128F9053|nr:STAS domain-containing protein [Brevundimonas sp. Bb-A]QFU30947.1 STAS domain protein [Brevundimonas sp. Bb-A]